MTFRTSPRELPELPEPINANVIEMALNPNPLAGASQIPYRAYTAEQMREYGMRCYEAGRGAERERCAKIADELAREIGPRDKWTSDIAFEDQMLGQIDAAEELAAAIRKG
jgi:hypothetical protein